MTPVITYSVNRLHIKRDGRVLGVYRSLGMTAGRLRLALLSGTALQTLAGAPAGLIIGAAVMPNLLDAMLRHYGIVDFPAVWNAGALAAAAAAGCAAMLLGSWLASAAVNAQSLRSLTEEA